jgi:hypothetical protein
MTETWRDYNRAFGEENEKADKALGVNSPTTYVRCWKSTVQRCTLTKTHSTQKEK